MTTHCRDPKIDTRQRSRVQPIIPEAVSARSEHE